MYGQRRPNDSVHWYMEEQSARLVAKSGRPTDRFHLGKHILQGLKDVPDLVLQIDGGTGKSETCGSVMERSVKCAEAMTSLGLQTGDVIVLMAPNHLDLCIPFYAALYIGVAIAPIDRTLGIKELEQIFSNDEPKIVFCQSEKASDVRTALNNCKVDAKIVTFDEEEDTADGALCFSEFLKKYDTDVYDFKPTNIDPEETVAVLLSTSGTTGLPKQAVCTHKSLIIAQTNVWVLEFKFPTPTKMALIVSPLQWGTAVLKFNLTPILKYTRLQTSKEINEEHVYELINKYKPTYAMMSPTMAASLLKSSRGKCDWTSFEQLIFVGGAVAPQLINEFKEVSPKTRVFNAYGTSELNGAGLQWQDGQMPGSSGKPCGHLQYRLVDTETKEDILEPNKPGELWITGPTLAKGYYKNPEATKEAFTEDGWYKTGDIFYRDENYNFFFEERSKMLLKYRNHQVSPAELQNVIRGHPGVLDVVVAGIPDYECGDLPVACVVRQPGSNVTAQEIKDLVKENLADTKQLRGGVIFLDALPLATGGKIDIKKIKEIVIQMEKE